MSVLIKHMAMPKGCIYANDKDQTEYCPLLNHDDVPFCQYIETEPEIAIGIDERPVYCPLSDVPDTNVGDLISRQAAIDATKRIPDLTVYAFCSFIDMLSNLPSAQQWIPVSELPSDNREVEVTCEVKRLDGKKCRYTCHASYVHRYSIESTSYCDWEECDEYNEEEDKYYALPGWYERVHNWDDYSYCAIEDYVLAWRELSEPYKGEQE